MPRVGAVNTPTAADALFPAFPGFVVSDATAIPNGMYDPTLDTARDVPFQGQSELLRHQQILSAGGGGVLVFNPGVVAIPAGPVSIGGFYGVDSVTGNPVYGVIAADATQDEPASAILTAALAPHTAGVAYAGGSFTSALNTLAATIGAPVYVTQGGIDFNRPDSADR